MSGRRITQTEIARRVGVSQRAVAQALMDSDGVSTRLSNETRQRVRMAALKLGYVPHRAARSLRLGKTNTIVVATRSQLHHPHVHEMIEEIREAFLPHGYQILLELLHRAPNPEGVLRSFAQGNVDGLIVHGYEADWLETLVEQLPKATPAVLLGPSDFKQVSSVTYDRAMAARLAVEHLHRLGHRQVAMVYDVNDVLPARQRVEGYRAACRASGLPFREELLIRQEVGNADVRALWDRLCRIHPRPTGVYCYNDELALRLLQVIHRGGLRVPEHVAIVAHGNTRLTMLGEVPLTAVDTNNRGVAQAAVEILLAHMQNPGQPSRQVCVAPSLVARASTVGQGDEREG